MITVTEAEPPCDLELIGAFTCVPAIDPTLRELELEVEEALALEAELVFVV